MKEHDIQKQIVSLLRLHDDIIIVYTDVMSGAKFCRSTVMKFINYHKAMGYTKGMCDLILFRHGIAYFIELKHAKGKLSPEQIGFKNKIVGYGYNHLVWRSIDDCLKWLKA